jgi:hypothetical protein
MSDFGERIRAFNVLFNPMLPQAWADGATDLLDQYFRHRQQYGPEPGLRRPIEALERAVAERRASSSSLPSREDGGR